jgi:hypothetical protein
VATTAMTTNAGRRARAADITSVLCERRSQDLFVVADDHVNCAGG